MKSHAFAPGRRTGPPVLARPWLPMTVLAALLVACGGGGSDAPAVLAAPAASPPASAPTATVFNCGSPPEGLQPATTNPFALGGTINGRADPSFIILTTPRNIWAGYNTVPYGRLLVYGPDLAASAVVSGFIWAGDPYWCSGAAFASNGYDVGPDGDIYNSGNIYMRTTVDPPAATVSGSIRYTSATYTLSGGPLPGATVAYSFNRPANVADVVGDWSLKVLGGGTLALTIGGDGTLTGTSSTGEAIAGWLKADAAGINLFDLRLGNSLGVVLAYPLATGEWQLLMFRQTPGPMEDIPSVAVGRR
jgi:hypothetical protein